MSFQTIRQTSFHLFGILFLCCAPIVAQDAWPRFRGPHGDGHVPPQPVPLTWTDTEHVRWKVAIPGGGWSSPVIVQGKVVLTSAVPVNDSRDHSLRVICLAAKTGATIWDQEVFLQDGETTPRIHSKNSYASPTPNIDGGQVFVHFGHEGTACLDLDGNVQWRNDQLRYRPTHGNGGSPILVDDKLVFSCDGSDQQFVVALDRNTGNVIWKANRPTEATKRFSFCTPTLVTLNDRRMIISPGSDNVLALDPSDGNELWQATYAGYSVVPKPVHGHGMVFFSTGYDVAQVLAIRTGGRGDVSDSHVAWTLTKGAPHTPSMILKDDMLFMVSDNGVGSCVDAKTGKLHWQKRLGGNYSSSPILADNRIYFQNEHGVTTVLEAKKTYRQLAKNDIGERTLASLAVADGAIFLRTEKHLYRIDPS